MLTEIYYFELHKSYIDQLHILRRYKLDLKIIINLNGL